MNFGIKIGWILLVIVGLAVLAVLLIGVIYLFFGWSAEISKPEQVKEMKIENDQLVIEVDTPNYYGQRDWWIDIDDTGTVAQVTICYGFGKNRKDNNIMRTPVNTDDYSDPLSREHMAKLEKIQGVHGVKVFVKRHAADILYNPAQTNPDKIQEAIFVPSKFRIQTPDHNACDSLKVVVIRTEGMYDKMDINYLGMQFRLTGKKLYGLAILNRINSSLKSCIFYTINFCNFWNVFYNNSSVNDFIYFIPGVNFNFRILE